MSWLCDFTLSLTGSKMATFCWNFVVSSQCTKLASRCKTQHQCFVLFLSFTQKTSFLFSVCTVVTYLDQSATQYLHPLTDVKASSWLLHSQAQTIDTENHIFFQMSTGKMHSSSLDAPFGKNAMQHENFSTPQNIQNFSNAFDMHQAEAQEWGHGCIHLPYLCVFRRMRL